MLALSTTLSQEQQPFRIHRERDHPTCDNTKTTILTAGYVVTNFDIQLVGSEAIVFTGPEGNAINTISATFGTVDGELPQHSSTNMDPFGC